MKRFIERHATAFVVFLVIVAIVEFFIAPMIANLIINTPAPHEIFAVDWEVEHALTYYSATLGFWGTVLLGVVAVYQNKRAHDLNRQMQKLQQAQFISMISIKHLWINKRNALQANYKNMYVESLESLDLTIDGFNCDNYYHVDILFKNESAYPIVQLLVHVGEWNSCANTIFGIQDKECAVYIPAQGEQAVRFIIPSQIFQQLEQFGVSLRIGFVNIFDYVTPSTIHIPDLENKSDQNEYKFRLAKFTDIRPLEKQSIE